MNLVAAFFVGFLGIPLVALLVAVYQTRNWTPPSEATPDFLEENIYTQHEAYNRYENLEYKEM
jgi:hypothetical protein